MRIATPLLSAVAAVFLLSACTTTKPSETGSSASDADSYGGQRVAGPATAPVEGVDSDMMRMEGTREFFANTIGNTVLFAYDSSALSENARETLKMQAAWMDYYPDTKILVEGHCDERGTREYNLALGARRATAVKTYLVALGVASNRIETISYGKERPVVAGTGPSVWSQNRRGVSVLRNLPAAN